MTINPRKILKTFIRVLLYVFGSLVLIIVLTFLFIRTETGQNFIQKKAVTYLTKKTGASVSIGKFRTDLLTHIDLQSVTIKDQSQKTLLHVGRLEADYRLFDLLTNTLTISHITVDTLDFRMARTETDTSFNYDFILRAFAGQPSTEPVDTTPGKPFNFNFGELTVRQLHFIMDDKKGRQFHDVKSNLISLNINKLDLQNQVYAIRSFATEGLTAKLDIGPSETEPSPASEGLLPKISIGKIALLNNNFSVSMPASGFQSESSIHDFNARDLTVDLNKNLVELKEILIDKHKSSIQIQAVQSKTSISKAEVTDTIASVPFSVNIGSIKLIDNDLKYDFGSSVYKSTVELNPDHIHAENLQLAISGFSMAGTALKGTIQNFKFKEQCGLEIKELNGEFLYADTGINLHQLVLKTPYTTIAGNFKATYKSIDDLAKNPGKLAFDVNASKILISRQDMRHFSKMAGNNQEIGKLMANDIQIEGKMFGKVDDMKIEKLKLQTAGMQLSASGTVKGLPDPDQLLASITLHEFSGSTKNLAALLPEGSIPPTIAANESFSFNGKLNAKRGAYSFDLLMNSSAGNLALDGKVTQLTGAEKLSYNVRAQSDGLLLDRILMDTLYGNTAFDIRANGKGISPETADAQVIAKIPVVFIKGYNYRNIDLNAAIATEVIDANFTILDSACNAGLAATYSLDSLNPIAKAKGHIENIDLHQLGFTTDTLKFKGDIEADMTTVNSKHINGTALLSQIEITKGLNIYKLDSVSLIAKNRDSTQNIAIKSPFLEMSLDGYYEIDVLPDVAQNLLIDYITVYPPTGTVFKPAYAKLKGELRSNPVIAAFVPGLMLTKTIKFGSVVDTKKKDLMLAISVPSAVYDDIIIDSTIFGLHTANDTLEYGLFSSGIRNSSFKLYHSYIEGKAKDGNINWMIQLYNRFDSLKYNLSGRIVNDTTKFVLHLNEKQSINGDAWDANEDNVTEYTTDGHIHTNLAISSGLRQLAFQSSASEEGLPLSVKLTDFPVTTLTKIVSADTAIVTGNINGSAQLLSMDPLRFSADLKIDSLRAYNSELGYLDVKAQNEPGIGYTATVNLTGATNDINLKASYSDAGLLSGSLDIKQFDLKSLVPFLSTMIGGLGGNLNGNVAFEGTVEKPVLTGQLKANDVQGRYLDYNTFFRVPEEEIIFTPKGIELNDFNVYDSTGNTANVTGIIGTSDYRNYKYDLRIKTDHFMAMNKKSFPEQEYYGPAFFTSDLKISSTENTMLVKGDVRVDEKSVINVEMSNVDTTISNNSGIIVYVDSVQTSDSSVFNILKEALSKEASATKMGLALNLEISKSSKLNIFLGNSGSDFMKVAGDGNLTINQLPGGNMDMQGKFIIDNGEYQMTIGQFIKRKFTVQQGSSLQWNGSPTDADIDLTALYVVNTTAEAILSGSQTSNKGAYKQNLPFEVNLILKNKLMKPAISFKLDMPEKEQNAFGGVVYSRVKQINANESELNKQVMGLLILNQFIPQDPLSTGSSSGSIELINYEDIARSTAGSIVSQQMNSMIASKVKIVDLDFKLDSKADYTTGEKSNATDLTVNMSKSLFNDRYTISVGSTFALEGSEEYKKNAAGLAGIYSMEYKITPDGRYRAKVYQKDEYEADYAGKIVQTGVGLVVTIDFNRYREILRKKK